MLRYYYTIIKWFENFLNILIVIILNIRFLGFKNNYPKHRFKIIQVLGNGPSLKNDIPKITANRKDKAVMVVNTFATIELFEEIKPEYYIIVDPAYFKPTSNERIKILQDSLICALQKTNWNMVLFLPYSARKSEFYKGLISRKSYINVTFIKNISIIGGGQKINTFLFRHNLANPLYQNVLVAALFVSIKMKFSLIHLWGADHSWLPNLHVNYDNSVSLNDKHISESDNNKIVLTDEKRQNKKLHEFLLQISRMFKEYHVLNSYSESLNISIINHTENSFIDAFIRK